MTANPEPVIFGEVLFDCFEDRSVLGGAPFNVAWNLKGLGREPLFIGAVGEDELGAQVQQALSAWGMRPEGLQVDPDHPTGQVQVRLSGGEPQYEILADQAYDHVDVTRALEGLPRGGILYHGSLALRELASRHGLETLRDHMGARVFMDVNLRAPWWEREVVHDLMRRATWVKLNQDELSALAPEPADDPEVQARLTLACFDLEAIIVTRASEGAMVLTRDGAVHAMHAPKVEGLKDTVGAGDAFSAVTLLGLLEGWPWDVILHRAAGFAARVCTLHGATTEDSGFYALAHDAWNSPSGEKARG
ncbi:carbohydrate kinase [Ectothiorhodospira haloalkaliphila]|uniref:carbohydrate kinase family protein n=1 Tax=Ectothiorhodospira haloalkaliphila TaxID=421628 RepID=UPI001EE832E0|nr:carbohydrate kinase [Ectothiorhodospira haloalkaliphila]